MLLKVENITVKYDKAVAIEDICLEVPEDRVVCIIGANGAGKSTILKALSGLTSYNAGMVELAGNKINGLEPYEIVKLGLVHIPEGRKLFPFLSVIDNLKLGASLRNDHVAIQNDLKKIFEHFPVLKERLKQYAGTLSGGEQQMLAIGRGLMANPKLLMLDEPSLGLAPIMVKELVPVIKNINKEGVSVLLVEQNIPLALETAHQGYVLQVGKIVLSGDIELFKTSDVVKKAYLGG